MGLGLSIDKLLEMLRADRHRSKEQTASYLDAVSSQAIALAAIWRGILTNAQLVEMEEPDAFIVGLRRLRERDMRKSYPQLFAILL
jgi:N-acyl-D-aspartate/D-glutamate deacylase